MNNDLTALALQMLDTIEWAEVFTPEIISTIRMALERGRPSPPAEGEVAELVAWLRQNAADERNMRPVATGAGVRLDAVRLDRAADLLERQQQMEDLASDAVSALGCIKQSHGRKQAPNAADRILAAFDECFELLGLLEENWQEVCLAAALRALAEDVNGAINIRAQILRIAAELEDAADG